MAGIESVVHADMGTRRGIGVGAFLLALVTAGAMAHVGVRMKGIEVAYDLGRERRINTQLEEERRRLNIEIGMLKDPVRVVSIARDKLQMGPPAPGDVVRLVPGLILGAPVATPPATVKRAEAPRKKPARVAAKLTAGGPAKPSGDAPASSDESAEATAAPDDDPPVSSGSREADE